MSLPPAFFLRKNLLLRWDGAGRGVALRTACNECTLKKVNEPRVKTRTHTDITWYSNGAAHALQCVVVSAQESERRVKKQDCMVLLSTQ